MDVITVEDKSDPYVSEMLSIGGYTVKNNLGGVVPYVIVRTNQKEVDSLLGSISETAPSAVFPSCLGKNALTLTVKYKRTDLKNYGNEVQINPGSNVCANNDLDPEYSCDVLYTLSDEFNTVTYSDFVSTAVYLMHFLHGGRTTSRSCS